MKKSRAKGGAFWVASGILLSRCAGMIRVRAFAHYLGNSDANDAFTAALKIPNFLQNLFGEGVLSASFIPVYASLLAEGDETEATKLAGAIATLLSLVVALLVLVGVLATPFLIDVIAPGFVNEKRVLTIHLVRIFFPATGLLVLSAWCLGILNSHRRFFLSYSAPVLWNFAIIGSLLYFGKHVSQFDLAIWAAWGLVAGSVLQLGVQLPIAFLLIKKFIPGFGIKLRSVRIVITNFAPVVVSRGVVQISAYIDSVLASLLPTGSVSALMFAQTIYLLPIGLFGMSVSAAELPAMSSELGSETERYLAISQRLNRGLKRIAFFVVPSAAAFLVLGDVIVGLLFQTGAFDRTGTLYVWAVLAGSTMGLLAATFGRLYSSTFYALRDTRTPLKFALIRVLLTTLLGCVCGLWLPGWIGIESKWGTVGLTASAGIAGWVEFFLLRKSLNQRITKTGIELSLLFKLWACALVAASIGRLLDYSLHINRVLSALFVLSTYGLVYLGSTAAANIEESSDFVKRFRRKAAS